ncbi:MAG: coenzyme synthetase, partial [Planctomycetes bacterium]|nr:coenzyme synthetase [Planctomycetota bacterium]
MDRPLAAPARIRHDYDALRAFVPQVLASARALAQPLPAVEAAAKAALAPRLALVRNQLLGSPYYLARLRPLGLAPGDLQTLDDLGHFPALSRAEFAAAARDLPALDPGSDAARQAVWVRSSGSTGEPADVLKDPFDTLHMWAVLRFWMGALGLPLPTAPRVVLLCALPGGLEYTSRLPALDDGLLTRISTAREEPLPRLLQAQPHILFTDPAGLHWLAAQPQLPRPLLALSSAQHLPQALRDETASRMGCPVLDYYSTSETGAVAWRCPSEPANWHTLTPEIWVESLDGELLVTRLRESVLPIVRYRTGDSGTVAFGPCACGRTGFRISGLGGRRACLFCTPDGRSVDAWALAWLFKYYDLGDFRLSQ